MSVAGTDCLKLPCWNILVLAGIAAPADHDAIVLQSAGMVGPGGNMLEGSCRFGPHDAKPTAPTGDATILAHTTGESAASAYHGEPASGRFVPGSPGHGQVACIGLFLGDLP